MKKFLPISIKDDKFYIQPNQPALFLITLLSEEAAEINNKLFRLSQQFNFEGRYAIETFAKLIFSREQFIAKTVEKIAPFPLR